MIAAYRLAASVRTFYASV